MRGKVWRVLEFLRQGNMVVNVALVVHLFGRKGAAAGGGRKRGEGAAWRDADDEWDMALVSCQNEGDAIFATYSLSASLWWLWGRIFTAWNYPR